MRRKLKRLYANTRTLTLYAMLEKKHNNIVVQRVARIGLLE